MKHYVLEVRYNFKGVENVLYPVILQNEAELILIDCGYPGFIPLLEKALQQHNLSLQNLTGIIITHHDIDHVGCLYELKEKYPALKIYSPEIEEPYINGQKKSLRLQQAEALYNSLPEEQKPGALAFQEMLKQIQPVPVDATFTEEELPFLRGVRVIKTPGHMPGHISLYLPECKTLIAADAVVIENGELEISNPDFTLDLKRAVDSIKKLQALNIQQLVCYHGGNTLNDIQLNLEKLIAKYAYL
ncbi:MBL fold metallo-hydrolase [Adhaeribacter radiodurans]|uniref:MBL fold metallo-hydrolase n=1 Tax=Adhaeribacter radiodurans TaxID=2745197 RepID=A0A7L7L3V1_9BACT|nr:MBL fold metallo-hydrolase [Adhaeribacter radiodurans]QMU27501.1 MBL fold metallo-hydrolase [Adhaeribacter radiodurans]